ncbi:NACHT domain-containing protein [Plantactinospora sp. WMMB782]|uniref:NACHT domain-containing protein n=1 Tax=Plantactinospora sp. WMMB782 TaxID=3404121 RepID=UPI003B941A5B
MAVGLFRLLRIPRKLRDQDVVRITRSADALLTVRHGIVGRDYIVRGHGRLRNRGKERTGSLLRLLGRALDDPTASVVLLQGQTGSGKTTALRRWGCTRMPREKRAHGGVVLPVYVDLSRFAATNRPIDADTYREHIAELLGRDDRFLRGKVMEFLQERRDHIRWIFLFDAFDELPELAGAENVKPVIERHLNAIRSLVETAPNLHAVIAARDFAGADARRIWPLVDVLPLPVGSQRALVRRFGLDANDTRWLTGLIDGNTDLRLLSENPLLLTLLCSFVSDVGTKIYHRSP